MSQITTVTFFKVESFSNKWWAFTQMQLGYRKLINNDGLLFYKLLGSGAKNGFSATPNFGTYALFLVWENEDKAQFFFNHNSFFNAYKKRSVETFTVYLKSAEAHGYWDGVQPFQKTSNLEIDKPIVVLTRARIHFNKLWSFWSKVGIVSQSLEGYKGVVLSIGVGEWPLIQQATISIWKTQAEMLDYAYKNPKHREVVVLTRKLNWYKEEMFARFVPYKFEGIWDGKNVVNFI
ncbi:DUF3291 domain-containing protein [Flavobacterium lacus]|uniref:Spheroidene monooxygenase n=1 Tax=Flavobacterium lacus TaxID=1353778 RepID=A0A328WWA1_9FLAO|nr:DUF3291 domain-containing protein [Flavobacterium lacus]RAR48114.1 spheroidene monooxygenase [Flavobacterium lacus]